ncbi:hypothetical protein [Paeniglutamicibacter terrestris]|uniref:Uncharacterized protein n=1 Tax=Paeniglutamicibacter terrestris TaxID=2723403 RepID=A0ABX1G4C4_9MICC|nr:hypothetical protein [Paeniglutamicibacter terrestris]NKG21074.1 hypothetical protein [Paeniglutamicibacter terrestris]
MTDDPIPVLPGQLDVLDALPPERLPDLPGCVRGIVGMTTNAKGRNVYTLQCEECLALETPTHLVLMKTHFHSRGDDRRRLCPDCRVHLFPDCICDHCREDRQSRAKHKEDR